MSCKPSCGNSGSIDPETGLDLMISRPGNLKFPKPMTLHPKCLECLGKDISSDLREFKSKTLDYLEKALNIPKKK